MGKKRAAQKDEEHASASTATAKACSKKLFEDKENKFYLERQQWDADKGRLIQGY